MLYVMAQHEALGIMYFTVLQTLYIRYLKQEFYGPGSTNYY